MSFDDFDLGDAMDVVDVVSLMRRVRRDGVVAAISPIVVRRAIEAGVTCVGGPPEVALAAGLVASGMVSRHFARSR